MSSIPAVPILMYHKVGSPVEANTDRFLNVSSRDFARQIDALRRLGYQGITFAEAARGLSGDSPLPRRPVCVTFDDGYCCVSDHAAPVMRVLGWPATVFVPTAYVGGANTWDGAGSPIVPIMEWPALRSLQDSGWEMSGHTQTHPRLGVTEDRSAGAEIEGGKFEIESNLGVEVHTFCYPFGSLNESTPGLVRRAGFIAACTVESGIARAETDPFRLPRVKIAYRDGLAGFLYRLLIRPRLP